MHILGMGSHEVWEKESPVRRDSATKKGFIVVTRLEEGVHSSLKEGLCFHSLGSLTLDGKYIFLFLPP